MARARGGHRLYRDIPRGGAVREAAPRCGADFLPISQSALVVIELITASAPFVTNRALVSLLLTLHAQRSALGSSLHYRASTAHAAPVLKKANLPKGRDAKSPV